MNEGQPFCKITGDQKIEKIKEKIWRIQLSVSSLEQTLRTLQRVWDEFQKPEADRDLMLLEALTFYAVVEYTKCFNSDLSEKLDPNIFNDQLPERSEPSTLSQREFHGLIMNYRNMHLVHSDRLLKVAETGGVILSNGEFGVGPVVVFRSYREDLAFYSSLNSLAATALQEAVRRRESAQQRLIDWISAGDAKITDEEIHLMPISDQISPREMWGLLERN